MVRAGIADRLRRQALLLGVAFQQVAPPARHPCRVGLGNEEVFPQTKGKKEWTVSWKMVPAYQNVLSWAPAVITLVFV